MVSAVSLVSYKRRLDNESLVEIVIWQLPRSLRGSAHNYKYRLALIHRDVCVMRYDNEDGKGDHKHVGDVELPYQFVDLDQLQGDFFVDAGGWLRRNTGRSG